MNKKIGRNDICLCGSQKKYKSCCLMKIEDELRYKRTEELTSLLEETRNLQQTSNITQCMSTIGEYFPEHKLIDITPYLTVQNYKQYQIKFGNKKTIMFAEKTNETKDVFKGREDTQENDMMVMYNGSYRTFQFNNFQRVIRSVCQMISN
jgi:hypothetical protein